MHTKENWFLFFFLSHSVHVQQGHAETRNVRLAIDQWHFYVQQRLHRSVVGPY